MTANTYDHEWHADDGSHYVATFERRPNGRWEITKLLAQNAGGVSASTLRNLRLGQVEAAVGLKLWQDGRP